MGTDGSEGYGGADGDLLKCARRVREYSGPSLVTGGLNDVAGAFTTKLMQRTSGILVSLIGSGLYSTFHAKVPVSRWPLEHVFHSQHFQLVDLKRLPAIGSDHYPVFAQLALTAEAANLHEEPKPKDGDRERFEEKIQEAEEMVGGSWRAPR